MKRICGYVAVLLLLAGGTVLLGDQTAVAVSARASSDYVRPRLADGTLAPESFAFGQGVQEGEARDASLDRMSFMDVLRAISAPLAVQKYVASRDPKTTRLLIMVYWGATSVPDGANESMGYANAEVAQQALTAAKMDHAGGAMVDADNQLTTAISQIVAENAAREREDRRNAELLGYESWWNSTQSSMPATALQVGRQDMFDELEDARYYVVLMAYDFQELWHHHKSKLLWETRYSIRERGHDFAADLAAMTRDASRYFGKDSRGLVHHEMPEARVEVGPARTVGVLPGN